MDSPPSQYCRYRSRNSVSLISTNWRAGILQECWYWAPNRSPLSKHAQESGHSCRKLPLAEEMAFMWPSGVKRTTVRFSLFACVKQVAKFYCCSASWNLILFSAVTLPINHKVIHYFIVFSPPFYYSCSFQPSNISLYKIWCFTSVYIKILVFWDVTKCSLISKEPAASVFRVGKVRMKAAGLSGTLAHCYQTTVSHPWRHYISCTII
jgi:hypothetical protein